MSKVLRPIYPNAGVIAGYQKRLKKELAWLSRSVMYWVIAIYRKQEGRLALDASPAAELEKDLKRHIRRWLKRWNLFAEKSADWFGTQSESTTTAALLKALKDAGFTVSFDQRRLTNNTVRALIEENINLIRSIASQYLTDVQGIVLRGMSLGRDVDYVRRELQHRHAVTYRRAKFIARDQCNKATEAIKFSLAQSLGIKRAKWVHVPGVKTSRRTHQSMDGQEYDIADGIYDSAVGYKVKPGELPGCQCVNRFIIPEIGDASRK